MQGRLTPQLLISTYAQGIFPMDVGGQIQWFSPDPRAILPLEAFHVPGTLRQLRRRAVFECRVDTCFQEVITKCSDRDDGTWISSEIIAAYTRLHKLGFAHSIEAWHEGHLAGGLYGVVLGGAFFGESMFHWQRDASKIALCELVDRLKARGFALLDVQWPTPHLRRFGVVEIPRAEYLRQLERAIRLDVHW